MRLPRFASALFMVVLCAGPAVGQSPDRLWHGTVFLSRWLHTDLPELPQNVVTGNLHFRETYFAGGALSRVLVPYLELPGPAAALSGLRIEAEGQLLRHFGEQRHFEATLALVLRTPQLPVGGGFSVNFAFAEGISQAFSSPRTEGLGYVRAHRFMNYLAFETELTHAAMPGVHVVGRLHHRSGAWGLIAPRNAGSNYVGLGVRLDLQ